MNPVLCVDGMDVRAGLATELLTSTRVGHKQRIRTVWTEQHHGSLSTSNHKGWDTLETRGMEDFSNRWCSTTGRGERERKKGKGRS